MPKRTVQAIRNPQLRAAMHEALAAQLALWSAIGMIEELADLPGDGDIGELLAEFAIDIDRREDVTDEVLDRAIAWLCFGEEIV